MIVCDRVMFTKVGSVLKTDKTLIVRMILVELILSIFGELSGHSNGPFFDTGCYNSWMGTPWLQTGTQFRTSKSQPYHNNGRKCNSNV